MIKLSPDLVSDRGRSRIAMTRHSQTHTCTHSPSDKPNYDPVRQPNRQKTAQVCVGVCANATRAKPNEEEEDLDKKISKNRPTINVFPDLE